MSHCSYKSLKKKSVMVLKNLFSLCNSMGKVQTESLAGGKHDKSKFCKV